MKTNKVITAAQGGICINYTDTNKHFFINYEQEQLSNQIEKNYSHKNYQDVNVNLNPHQIKMYRLALYGIETLSEKEVIHLSPIDKLNIKHKQEVTQKMINRWKQQLTQSKINSFLSKLFPNSKFIEKMVEDSDYYCDGLINYLSFKELGITHKNILDKMIEFKSLPDNFYQLKN